MAIGARLLTLVMISLPLYALHAELAGRSQDSAAVVQLRQEIGNLRFRLDYETNRMQRLIDDLQRQVRQTAQGSMSVAPLPTPRPMPAEVGTRSPERLHVEDGAGRRRAALTVNDRFGPMMALMGPAGDVEAMLSVPVSGPRLELFDRAGRSRLVLGLEGGSPELRMLGEDGSIVQHLRASTEDPE